MTLIVGPTWGHQDPVGPHVGHMNLALWDISHNTNNWKVKRRPDFELVKYTHASPLRWVMAVFRELLGESYHKISGGHCTIFCSEEKDTKGNGLPINTLHRNIIWTTEPSTIICDIPKRRMYCVVDLCPNPSSEQGLPYIPRVHLSEGSLVRSRLKWLWFEEPMVRRSFIPKFLFSESCYVPKIPYSERPSNIWILCCEGSLVRSSSRRFYLPNFARSIRIFCYEGSSWWNLNFTGHKIS